MGDPTVEIQTSRLVSAVCRVPGINPSVTDRAGFTIASESGRAGTRLASAYQLRSHLLVRCDPDVVELCHELLGPPTPASLAGFEQALPDTAERLGRGWIHLIDPGIEPGPAPADPQVRRLDPHDDIALITRLVTDDPEGADEAEIDLDELDAHMVGVVEDGVLVAYASERPWDADPAFADIGVTTHPGHRRRGLGAAVVAAVTARVVDSGRMPMYRCNDGNEPSRLLAERVGFVAVASLTAAYL